MSFSAPSSSGENAQDPLADRLKKTDGPPPAGPDPLAEELFGAEPKLADLPGPEDLDSFLGAGPRHAQAESVSDQTGLETARLQALVDELTDKLAREQAAFHNFRQARALQAQKEMDRTRAEVVRVILPVLDDLDRAQKHGDLEPHTPLGAIATKLRQATSRLGLESYAAPGDDFDPKLHEAIFQKPNPEAVSEKIVEVVESGYILGQAQVRVAKVVVEVPVRG